ncbi:DUF3348 domain-containing protein [Paraburkholderia kururiensis]|uniref:DUF3348 domain-containing protein n=1 Tax=Paraburkholderia kururiensis TaxID=984307 RepID=UPI000F88464C|nr:DUF3348 domain-containing protein [Paraburkholderia kururiensis]
MVQAPPRTAFGGPTLVRLLARLADADVPASTQSLSDRLSQWLGWTDAIALSSALNANPPAVMGSARPPGRAEDELCASVRNALTKAIANDAVLAVSRRTRAPRGGSQAVPEQAAGDYAAFRQSYLSLQQAMETDIGDLRGRLRALLAARTSGLARLAVLDAVMERALFARERTLLVSVPTLLGVYFERLCREAQADAPPATDASNDAPPMLSGERLDAFRRDVQSVLLAELEVRFQPVEALLAALRTRQAR